jgi:hypothetical protein
VLDNEIPANILIQEHSPSDNIVTLFSDIVQVYDAFSAVGNVDKTGIVTLPRSLT